MRYSITTLLLLILLTPISSFGQISRLKYADKLYEKYDYIDAQKVYLQVINKGYKSAQIYVDLADSYYYQSDYKEAAFWYQKLLENYPEEVNSSHYLRAIQSLKGIKDYTNIDSLMQSYTVKYKESSMAKHYGSDPYYLESIQNKETNYIIKELAINSSGSDHSPIFYGKDKIVYASSSLQNSNNKHSWNGEGFLDLFLADRDTLEGDLRNKRVLRGDVNSILHESAAVFTKDGNTMYFTRNNIVNGEKLKDKQNVIRLRIFKAELQVDDTWKVVEDLPFNHDSYSVAYPALNAAEDKLYFSSDKEGTLGMSDIWFVDLKNRSYGDPVHLGADINTEGREAFLFIDSNDVLYFSSDGHLGLGGMDIFRTQLNTKGFPEVIENVGVPFNSPQDDFALVIDPKKDVGYFTSNREDAKSLNDDIYYFYKDCIIKVKGQLKDKQTKELLVGGTVRLLNQSNELIEEFVVDIDGNYSFELACDTEYLLQGRKEEYTIEEFAFATPNKSGALIQDLELEIDGPCAPNDLGCRLGLEPIYFDFDKDNIRPDAAVELSKVLAAMELYSELIIHIESHTDSRGNDAYNMRLSERRAQSTRDWLISNGIDTNRLTARGYGESHLINKCENGVECIEEEHQLNRRSMFIIQD